MPNIKTIKHPLQDAVKLIEDARIDRILNNKPECAACLSKLLDELRAIQAEADAKHQDDDIWNIKWGVKEYTPSQFLKAGCKEDDAKHKDN